MNKEQAQGIEQTLGITVSPLAQNLISVATAFCWQPIRIENGIMVLGVYENDPLRLIDKQAKEIKGRRTDTGHIRQLCVDLQKEEMNEITGRFIKDQIVTPLSHEKFGPKSQKLFEEAKKALIVGDYDYSAENIKKASRGNPDYNNKQKHIKEKLDQYRTDLKTSTHKETEQGFNI